MNLIKNISLADFCSCPFHLNKEETACHGNDVENVFCGATSKRAGVGYE